MNEIFEILFENINKEIVLDLFLDLLSSSDNLLEFTNSEDLHLNINDKKSLIKSMHEYDNFIFIMKLDCLILGSLSLKKVIVRIVKYLENYDIEVNWEVCNKDRMTFLRAVPELHSEVKKLARKYKVDKFYSGMEPASDKGTRLFTGDELGPLSNGS